ncbi:hypothetical protein SH580_00200 [Coraliomargarita algicola]|uniref:Uncharacterized protein n=1 Tax=Coraliomargarita algicola TaxID=3092156 RepID=A0ABZ0RIU3_9BACT|nr:hypothetical protein [Coraliomargarita sp. J2-16]WPJ96119.1 hypothetical protein SH580_00200 [Coraliomargarita sp. J2-16]
MKAEQNAVLALRVALGRLQLAAGPDQRVSARADILTDLSNSSGEADISKKYLTGIWSTEPVAEGTGEIEKLEWLVSGAPDVADEPDWHQNAWTGDTVVVVSDQTADTNDTDGDANDYEVAAGKVELQDTQGDTVGHYAYWVGDEGIKAKVNMTESEEALSDNPSNDAKFNRLHAVQRIDPSILEDGTGLDYSVEFDRSVLSRVFSRGLFDSVDQTGGTFLKTGFHDYTLSSKGLLTNALNGGLKTDLTRGLDDQPLTGDIFQDVSYDKVIPNWETMSSYYQLPSEISSDQVAVRAQTDTSQGLAPVILQVDLYNGLYFKTLPSGDYQLYVIYWSALVLHNPYDVALAPADYIVESSNYTEKSTSPFRFYLYDETGDNYPYANGSYYSPLENIEAATGTASRFVRYQTASPLAFAPGEVKVISTQTEDNFELDGFYSYADMPAGAKVLKPGYMETNGFLMMPLTVNSGPLNNGGIYTYTDLFNSDGTPKTFVFKPNGGHTSVKLYAIRNGAEEYIGGQTLGTVAGNTTVATKDENSIREVRPDFPIGMNGCSSRINLPRSNYLGYGYRLYSDFNYRAIAEEALVDINHYIAVPTQNLWSELYWNTTLGNGMDYSGESAFAGRSTSFDGLSEVVLFSVPQEKIFSLGDLRHANLRKYRLQRSGLNGTTAYSDYNDISIPSYVVGNSWANIFTPREVADYTYRVNEALWDQYYFSSIPLDTTDWSKSFPNSRIVTQDFNPNRSTHLSAILDRDRAAEYLAVDGAFNVNSTSVKAWRAILGGLSDLVDDPDVGSQKLDNIFPRITNWSLEDYRSGDISGGNVSHIPRMWSGSRSLTDDEMDALAEEIVAQVKLRGPFASLASFVNRTLIDKDPEENPDPAPSAGSRLRVLVDQHDTTLKGTLQAAIDNVDVDDDGLPDLNEDLRQADFQTSLGDDLAFTGSSRYGAPLGIIDSTVDATYSLTYSGIKDEYDPQIRPAYLENSYGLISADAPGFLSQMDILSALAPLLTVRSDTFTIRTYGDSVNPVTGDVIRSWCEAVVQRTAEAIDSTRPAAGRLFKVVSFRWLNEDEV